MVWKRKKECFEWKKGQAIKGEKEKKLWIKKQESKGWKEFWVWKKESKTGFKKMEYMDF